MKKFLVKTHVDENKNVPSEKNGPIVVDQATNQEGEKFVMSYVPYILLAQK